MIPLLALLWDDDLVLELTVEEWAIFDRPINGEGGAQGLLRALHKACTAPRTLRVEARLVDRAYQYKVKYGGGGFQDRFAVICDAALRTGQWSSPGIDVSPRPRRGGAFGH